MMQLCKSTQEEYRSYEYFGAHICGDECVFRVWAPNANEVFILGEFNNWTRKDPGFKLSQGERSGVFELKKKGIDYFSSYKYLIVSENGEVEKTDPYSFCSSDNGGYSSKIYNHSQFNWQDSAWMESRGKTDIRKSPLNIYECHLGSWKRNSDGSFISYKTLAENLVSYVKGMGYTHIELLPVMEHPFYGSWGYQICNYFAPSSRFGSPDGLKYLVNFCHCHGIGVIFDWNPAHFPKDEHGLFKFDGSWCYEYSDDLKREHPSWKTCSFDYTKKEVCDFLVSNAMFWIDKYHIDGIRVDAVSSMIFLDFDRDPGQWSENRFGGRENLEAIDFLRLLNRTVNENYPDVFTVAEDCSAWQMVTRPETSGGLGFTFKWNSGWSHDTLDYLEKDSVLRKNIHRNIVFPVSYAFSENYILPLSHDDVSLGRKSIFDKAFGNDYNKFSSIRLLLGYMIAHPGKKLTFMGFEFGQEKEWNHDTELEWNLLENEYHFKLFNYTKELNYFYLEHSSLWKDNSNRSYKWISKDDSEQNIIAFIRRCDSESLIFLLNFAPTTRYDYRIGVPNYQSFAEVFSSDNEVFGGSGIKNDNIDIYPFPQHGFSKQISLTIPPLSIICLKCENIIEE